MSDLRQLAIAAISESGNKSPRLSALLMKLAACACEDDDPDGLFGSFVSVPNLAALMALPAAGLADGTLVFVQSDRAFFTVRTQANPLVPNQVVSATPATKQWSRLLAIPHPTSQSQVAWFLDPVAGNDENAGDTTLTALRTAGEFSRRIGTWGYVNVTLTVTLLSSLPASDAFQLRVVFGPSGSLVILGTPTVLSSGAVTGVTPQSRVTNTRGNLTTSVPAGTFIGKQMTLTSGANAGAYAWVQKVVAGNTINTSTFLALELIPNIGFPVLAGAPAIGDTYEIRDLPQIPNFDLEFRCVDYSNAGPQQIFVTVKDVDLCSAQLPNTSGTIGSDGFASSIFLGCIVNVVAIYDGCDYLMSGCNVMTPAQIQGRWYYNGGTTIGQDVQLSQGSVGTFAYDYILQGGTVKVRRNSLARFAASAVFDSPSDGVALTQDAARSFSRPFALSPELLWGGGNAGFGIRCNNFLHYMVKPILTGGAGDTSIGGIVTPYGGVPFTNAIELAAIRVTLP